MSNDYANAWDALGKAIGSVKGSSSGSITEMEALTTDQRLKAAEVAALLSIAQELSALNPNNIKSRDKDGVWRNGWGLPAVE